jgi:hypothetical protein
MQVASRFSVFCRLFPPKSVNKSASNRQVRYGHPEACFQVSAPHERHSDETQTGGPIPFPLIDILERPIAPGRQAARVASVFRFPPSLLDKHEEEQRNRAIRWKFALASGVHSTADNDLQMLNFQASLPRVERKKALGQMNNPNKKGPMCLVL